MGILFHVADSTPAEIGGIDEYTVLMMHMYGDQSDSQHTITPNGEPQFYTAQSKFGGGSMYFEENGDYFTAPNSSDWDFGTGNFTIDFWIRPTTLVGVRAILGVRANGTGWGILGGDSSSEITFYDEDFDGATSGANITVDTWHHIAIVRKGTGTDEFSIYIDGYERFSGTCAVALSNEGNPLGICQTWPVGMVSFPGYLDELRISKGIARWTSDFSGSLPTSAYTSDANAKLLLHFDGDASASAHIVTSNGNPQLNAAVAQFDGSMYFDGAGDYLQIPDSANWDFDADFTIDFWINSSKTGGDTHFIATGHPQPGTCWYVKWGVGGQGWSLGGVNGSSEWNTSYTGGMDGSWHHVAFVRNGNDVYFYLDGTQQGTTGCTSFTAAQTELLVGCSKDNNVTPQLFVDGYIDELRISKGIARWTSNFTPETGPYTT